MEHVSLSSAHTELKTSQGQLEAGRDSLQANHDDLKTSHEEVSASFSALRLTYEELMKTHEAMSNTHDEVVASHDELARLLWTATYDELFRMEAAERPEVAELISKAAEADASSWKRQGRGGAATAERHEEQVADAVMCVAAQVRRLGNQGDIRPCHRAQTEAQPCAGEGVCSTVYRL